MVFGEHKQPEILHVRVTNLVLAHDLSIMYKDNKNKVYMINLIKNRHI